MLIDEFVLYTIFAFFMLFIGLTNVVKLIRETRLVIMVITAILFFYLAASAFNIEDSVCAYSSGWICQITTAQDLGLVALNFGFALLSVLYIIMEMLGFTPKELGEM